MRHVDRLVVLWNAVEQLWESLTQNNENKNKNVTYQVTYYVVLNVNEYYYHTTNFNLEKEKKFYRKI